MISLICASCQVISSITLEGVDVSWSVAKQRWMLCNESESDHGLVDSYDTVCATCGDYVEVTPVSSTVSIESDTDPVINTEPMQRRLPS